MLMSSSYLFFPRWELVLFAMKERPFFVVVVEHPLAEVVRDVEGAVVVAEMSSKKLFILFYCRNIIKAVVLILSVFLVSCWHI